MEIWDIEPEEWPEPALEPFKDVISDPAAWAKKCVETYGAQAICLQLKSTDPNDQDASPESAAETVQKVLAAIDVPLIVWGCTNPNKDEEVLKVVAEKCEGKNLLLGPVEEKNYKGIGAAAMGYGQSLISSSPIDVNLAKQVNILLENLGMPMDRVIVDPTTGGLGYGLEYTYSVMERLYLAAMSQGDDKLQFPMVNNIGNEVWKCKEAKQSVEDEPLLGDPERRGVLMEAVAAVTYLMSGGNLLILRHPESIRLTKEFIDVLLEGGDAMVCKPIAKKLQAVQVDFASLAPAPDLTIEEEKKAPAKKAAPQAPPAKEKAPAPQAPAPAAKTVVAKQEEKAVAQKVEAPKEDTDPALAAKMKAEAEAKEKAEIEARKKAEEEARAQAKAEAEAKAEAKEKAAIEAKKKAEDEERERREQEEAALRAERAKAKAGQSKLMQNKPGEETLTPAAIQYSQQEKILQMLSRIHKR
ncbi:unnamed protein product [Cyprideis torosa]|uniref:CO dehydrogenase/acetyl-CoA synthase delta subunit TIM barrel domain-containing protein n=1 Tax=Cyprideis torosa TaxID=163714 RepID=A0A7R8WII8_9CRUS|nr:unnamed protein product [Cyprideis torosa]CAG0898893.1 unnamed protein product [Cyprideis torosa]